MREGRDVVSGCGRTRLSTGEGGSRDAPPSPKGTAEAASRRTRADLAPEWEWAMVGFGDGGAYCLC